MVTLDRSGRATVTQTISWGQYGDDELTVKLAASDPSLVVPEKLVLQFERHQFHFEYELKAGPKAGEFRVTLTPAAGKPVVVTVVVK